MKTCRLGSCRLLWHSDQSPGKTWTSDSKVYLVFKKTILWLSEPAVIYTEVIMIRSYDYSKSTLASANPQCIGKSIHVVWRSWVEFWQWPSILSLRYHLGLLW